jgi:dTDP-4-dehydrorhamnose 3,5-epimerase-like enzyme
MAWVPPGFGHGFLVLSGTVDVMYKVTALRHEAGERCLLSPKDAEATALGGAEVYE